MTLARALCLGNEWLNRSLRKAGRARYAIELAKNAIEIPRHPRWNGPDIASSSAQYGPGYLLATLDEFELWEELIALSSSPYFDEQVDEAQQVERAYLLGKAHAFLADDDGFDEALFQLEEYAADAQTSRVRRDAEGRMAILSTLFDALGGRDVEESLEVLEDEDLDDLTLARLCTQADVPEEAQKFARKLVDQYAGRALPLATLAHALERGGRHAEALETFEELRALSAGFDLDLPAFRRLAPLALAAGLPEDWRLPYDGPAEMAGHVELDGLGPALWSPPIAPDWSATESDGTLWSMEDTRGNPRVLILFLGLGCVHCVEQLQAFGPYAEEFSRAGVELIAIGDDTPEALAKAGVADVYPFPVLSDPEHTVFHEYRSYDDFENMPLHGTFLIDANDRIRWMDVGPEPFTEAEFLLAETERLLKFDVRDYDRREASSPSAPGGFR